MAWTQGRAAPEGCARAAGTPVRRGLTATVRRHMAPSRTLLLSLLAAALRRAHRFRDRGPAVRRRVGAGVRHRRPPRAADDVRRRAERRDGAPRVQWQVIRIRGAEVTPPVRVEYGTAPAGYRTEGPATVLGRGEYVVRAVRHREAGATPVPLASTSLTPPMHKHASLSLSEPARQQAVALAPRVRRRELRRRAERAAGDPAARPRARRHRAGDLQSGGGRCAGVRRGAGRGPGSGAPQGGVPALGAPKALASRSHQQDRALVRRMIMSKKHRTASPRLLEPQAAGQGAGRRRGQVGVATAVGATVKPPATSAKSGRQRGLSP